MPPTAPLPTATATAIDGRTARRDRNREAVLDAALELFGEGVLTPSATEVAERSGVSLRSVYRYYEDLEELLRAAIARNVERNQHLFVIEGVGEGPLEERIERFVERRSRVYESLADMARAAVVRARTNEILHAQLDRQAAMMRGQSEAMFAPELATRTGRARQELADAVALATSFDSLEQLRTTVGRSAEEARQVMRTSLRALLGP